MTQTPDPAAPRVLLTGHSRGLGLALATQLLEAGLAVLALSRAAAPGLAGHPGLTEVALDLADSAAVAAFCARPAFAGFLAGAGPRYLVNNAGTVAPIGPAGSLAPAEIARAVAVNVTAPLILTDAFIAATAASTDRRVMQISSGAGRRATPGWSVYCATKAALDMHAESTALDAPAGLRIASVAPGVVDTDMQGAIRATTEAQFTSRARFVALKDEGGLTAPADCARALLAHLGAQGFGQQVTADIRTL